MSSQGVLFHDSVYDAISADIAAIGGIKKCAALLWPTNSDSAGRLRACLAAGHPQKLDPEEVMSIKRLARDVGSYATVNYEAMALAFKVEWISPEDAEAQLQREFIAAVNKLSAIAKARS